MEQFVTPPDLADLPAAAASDTSSRQIQLRGREYEESIRLDYLNRLNERYEAWISTYTKGKVLVINVDQMDFENNPEELGEIITKVDAELNGLF